MISVVIPVYNVEDYIDCCVGSVVSQDYKNLEIILVDDGSTDRSGVMCDDWAKKDARIKVIHKPNGGLSDARNAGIDIARGEYIAFIDSDDFILPGYLKLLHDLISRYDADMSVCQLLTADENGNLSKPTTHVSDIIVHGNEQCMRRFVTDTSIDTTAWRKLYRTELFTKRDIRYPVGRYHEDVFTTYRIISHCQTIAISGAAMYAYRQRSGSIVNSTFSPKHIDAITGNLQRYDFIASHYPSLESLAAKGIIHACNICVMRMGRSYTDPSPYLALMKPLYRRFILKYLRSNCRPISKIFALAATMNIKLLVKVISRSYK